MHRQVSTCEVGSPSGLLLQSSASSTFHSFSTAIMVNMSVSSSAHVPAFSHFFLHLVVVRIGRLAGLGSIYKNVCTNMPVPTNVHIHGTPWSVTMRNEWYKKLVKCGTIMYRFVPS